MRDREIKRERERERESPSIQENESIGEKEKLRSSWAQAEALISLVTLQSANTQTHKSMIEEGGGGARKLFTSSFLFLSVSHGSKPSWQVE